MVYKFVDGNYVINNVNQLFNIDYGTWQPRAIEYLSSALRLLKVPAILEPEIDEGEVVDYRYELPCDIESLSLLEYAPTDGDSEKIYETGSKDFKDLTTASARESTYEVKYYQVIGDKWIQLSFESGHIKVHYKRYPLNSEGLPVVPDNEKVIEYCSWFILMRLLGRGIKHPVHNYKEVEFKVMGATNRFSLLAQARNSVTDGNIDDRARSSIVLRGIVKDETPFDVTLYDSATENK